MPIWNWSTSPHSAALMVSWTTRLVILTRRQVVPAQTNPALHWAAVVQVVPQALPLHRKAPQSWVAAGSHAPTPLQRRASDCTEPEQVCAPQGVPVVNRRQAPRPLQPPMRPQVLTSWAGHSGVAPLSLPSGTGLHVPTEPDRLQA
jgi:hypothetical protein